MAANNPRARQAHSPRPNRPPAARCARPSTEAPVVAARGVTCARTPHAQRRCPPAAASVTSALRSLFESKSVPPYVRAGGRLQQLAAFPASWVRHLCALCDHVRSACRRLPRSAARRWALPDLRQAFQPEKWTQQYKTARTRLSAGAARLAVVGRCAPGRLFGAWRSARGSWEAPQEEVREAGACAAARSKHATHCLPDANERSSCLGSGEWGWEGYRAVMTRSMRGALLADRAKFLSRFLRFAGSRGLLSRPSGCAVGRVVMPPAG